MYSLVMCTGCFHTFTIETGSFEIAYPLDYENRIKKYIPDNCRKCGEAIEVKPLKVRPKSPDAELFERK